MRIKSLLLVVALVALTGCQSESDKLLNQKYKEMRRAALYDAWQSCIDKGGVPIQDDWLGAPAMERCDFPKE
jgi:hypothetical protein